jgi:hypothetical protein
MIFPIKHITKGISRIYEVPLIFFENIALAHSCEKELFPKWFQPVYTRSPGLKDQFQEVFNKVKKLNKSKQRVLIDKYRKSKEIHSICNDSSNLYKGLKDLDPSIQKPIKDLFTFLYENTIGTAIFKQCSGMHIDDHYTKFFEENEVHVCPFCGLETYTFPIFRRAEYDHYLPISIYPWLGVNLNNLVPMGDHCNGKKNDVNILFSDRNFSFRRKVWYPYEWIPTNNKLTCIKKPTIHDIKGVWKVTYAADKITDNEKVTTWSEVFQIELRYSEAIKQFHKKFIEDLIHKNNLYGNRLTVNQLKIELRKYMNNGIGDIKLETMANLKFIWAQYHYNITDKSQLSVLIYKIANQQKKIRL